MARLTIEDCVKQVPNRFELIRLTALRAKQLRRGARALVPTSNGDVVTALREAAAGFVQPCPAERPAQGAPPRTTSETRSGGERKRPSSKRQPRRVESILISGGDPSPLEIGALSRPRDPDVGLDEDDLVEDEVNTDLGELLEDGGVF